MPEFAQRFFDCYCAQHGYDPQKSVQAYVERELSVRYPVVMKQLPGHLIVGVAPQIADACEPIEQELSENASIGDLIDFLFDDQIAFEPDESYIAALDPQKFQPVTVDGMQSRLLDRKDARALRSLEKMLDRKEKLLAQVSIKDDLVVGLFDGNTLVSAASLLRFGELFDVGVMTHPQWRGRGCGAAAVSALCDQAIQRNMLVQYRADASNAPSVALMKKLGFETMIQIHGAVIRVKGA